MTETEVAGRTRAYIVENFLYMRRNFEFGDDESLLRRGIIDSMGVMEHIEFIRQDFGVTVDDGDITEENFGSLSNISRFVVAKQDQPSREVRP